MAIHMKELHCNQLPYCRAFIKYFNNQEPYQLNKDTNITRYNCSQCPSKFLSQERLINHQRSECCRKYVCLICNMCRNYVPEITRHLAHAHNNS